MTLHTRDWRSTDSSQRIRTLLPPLLVVLLVVPALQPLWQPGLQQTDDGAHHLFRLFNLALAQRDGFLGTRWLADEGFGYGFPVLNFYAPLAYYFGLIFHTLGAGFASALEWALAAGLTLAALAMYALIARLFDPWRGVIAAVVYTWAPYHLADAWTRGALGELLAFVWLPLLLLTMQRTAQSAHAPTADRFDGVGWGALCLAGLILTHNLTLILAAPLVLGWTACLLIVAQPGAVRRRIALRLSAIGALGVLLSAAFWLPALTETGFVQLGQVQLEPTAWATAELAHPAQIIELRWDHLYTPAQAPPVLHALPLPQALLMLAGLSAGLWRWRRLTSIQRLLLALAALLALLAIFMQTDCSSWLWRSTPELLLLQFPWRWQTLGVLCAALLTAFLTPSAPDPAPASPHIWGAGGPAGPVVLLVILALLLPAALARLPWETALVPTTDVALTDANANRATLALYDYGRGLWLRQYGNAWMFEYMPVWAAPRRSDFFLSAGPAPPGPALTGIEIIPGPQALLARRFSVNSPQAWTLQLHQFYFPGWQALVDGQPAPVQPVGPLALAGVTLPAGQHDVILRFGSTPVRRLGSLISGGSLALALVWQARRLRRSHRMRRNFLITSGAALLIFALLPGVRWLRPAVASPTPLQAQFGQDIALIGFQVVAAPQPAAGEEVTVTLTWLALRRPIADYKVFVHLLDSQGTLWAQHDGEPGFFFSPTTRWQAGEIQDDHHSLAFVSSPPPGRYQLRIGLYDGANGQRLDVTAVDGTPAGSDLLLTEIEIGAAPRQP